MPHTDVSELGENPRIVEVLVRKEDREGGQELSIKGIYSCTLQSAAYTKGTVS